MHPTSKLQSIARLACLAAVALSCAKSWAEPTLPTFFTDHMVLQRDREIHVWGKADPGEKVFVTLAGRKSDAAADASGRWSVNLRALAAGGPFILSVKGTKEILIKDVMIGEVWIASGQSNMTFSLGGSENAATDVPAANYPQIRLFTVPKKIALTSQDNTLPAHWEICNPDTAKGFSAVGYFFARDIHRKLNVPVGIIESAWPGTPIQQWINPEVLRADPELKSDVDEWDRATAAQKAFAGAGSSLDLEFDDFELLPSPPESRTKSIADFNDGSSRTTNGGSFQYSWTESPNTAFALTAPGRGNGGFAAQVSGTADGTTDSILSANYAEDGSSLDMSSYAGIRFWVRGSGSFRFRSKQPTITDYDDYAAPVTKATADWQPATIWFRDLRQDGWGVVSDFTANALSGFSIECLTTVEYAPMPVSSLYEGMITPILPYPVRGALWYQGESNALQAYRYRKLLPAMIRNWREAFHQNNLEFLIVQLPNHGAIPDQPADSAWAELREAELMTAKNTPYTGIAVTIDVGDPKDLHPHRKKEVGERLALWALGTTYKQPIEYSGPQYQSMKVEGSDVRLHFTHALGMQAQGVPQLQGFALAGADRKFHWAEASIDGDNILVRSSEVPSPVAVRYAWGDSPNANLFNKDGLPASPFRTDDWPGITAGH
jgi:sialate O-acetylesterase